jgi:hypothetical protein
MAYMPQLTIWLFHLGPFIIAPALGAVAGAYWFSTGVRLLRRKRLILSAPASKIRSASMGLVEISGLATSPYLMTSPLMRAECYYYRTVVWERKDGNGAWVKVAEEILHVPFYVDDHTDKVLIDPRGAGIALERYWRHEYNRAPSTRAEEMPARIVQFLQRHGIDPAKKHIRLEESCIRPKDFLFVLGTLSQNPGLDVSVKPAWAERADRPTLTPEVQSEGPEIIRLSGEATAVPAAEMTQQQKIAAALMRAGVNHGAGGMVTSSQERHPQLAVKEPSLAEVATTMIEESAPRAISGFDLHPPVVLMKSGHASPFFISSRSPRERFNSFDWQSCLLTLTGPALVLVCTYLLLVLGFGVR